MTEAHPLAYWLAEKDGWRRFESANGDPPWRCGCCVLGGVVTGRAGAALVESEIRHITCLVVELRRLREEPRRMRQRMASGAAVTNAQRTKCPGCEMVASPGGLATHRKARGH